MKELCEYIYEGILDDELYEGILDDEDVLLDKVDDIRKLGYRYAIQWYIVNDSHDFNYMFKLSDIKNVAKRLGYLNRDFYSRSNFRYSGMSKVKDNYMFPLATIIGHVYFDDINTFEKLLTETLNKYSRSFIHVDVSAKSTNDDSIYVTLRRFIDENKTISMRFKFINKKEL